MVDVVQSLSYVQLLVTPRTAARQATLSFTISQSLLKLMSIELVMPCNHLVLCHSLLLLSVFPSIRVFSKELAFRIQWPKYWSFIMVTMMYIILPQHGQQLSLVCENGNHLFEFRNLFINI